MIILRKLAGLFEEWVEACSLFLNTHHLSGAQGASAVDNAQQTIHLGLCLDLAEG